MKAKELRDKTREDLQTLLNDYSRKQFVQKMEKGNGTLKKNHQLSNLRKDVARIKTVMTEIENKKEIVAK